MRGDFYGDLTAHNKGGAGLYEAQYQNDIETIFSALTGARRTQFFDFATSPAPSVENFLAIRIYGLLDGEEVLYGRLFLYSDVYIWNSYVGIYRITKENSDKIWQVYLESILGIRRFERRGSKIMIGKQAAIHLIFSMIFNQSCKSEVAFKASQRLLERLAVQSFDLREIEAKGQDALYNAISEKPCLHRFPSVMAKHIYHSVLTINDKHDSDPRNIWSGKTDSEILKELTTLNGMGRHKAIQCLIYLNILDELSEVSQKYIDYMAEKCAGFFENIDNDLQFIRSLM